MVYNKQLGTIASSGIEKTVRLWSEFTQPTFTGAKLEQSFTNFGPPPTAPIGPPTESALARYQRVVYDDSDSVLPQYQEDEEMISFFDAMNSEHPSPPDDSNHPEVDESSIVGTSWMLHFHDSDPPSTDDDDSSSTSSSSSEDSGNLESISLSDAERVEQEEALQTTREAHVIKRQLQAMDTGIAVPAALVPSSSDTDSSDSDHRAQTRRNNAKRKRK